MILKFCRCLESVGTGTSTIRTVIQNMKEKLGKCSYIIYNNDQLYVAPILYDSSLYSTVYFIHACA